jgi:hypothetical protein
MRVLTQMRRPARFLVPLALFLAACAAPAGTSEAPGASSSGSAAPAIDSGSPNASLPVSADVPQELVAEMLADAAERSGPSDEPRVVLAEAVTWSDGSLGCPRAGMGYTQALVPGYRVVIETGAIELHYHASTSGAFTHCADPQPPAEGAVDH